MERFTSENSEELMDIPDMEEVIGNNEIHPLVRESLIELNQSIKETAQHIGEREAQVLEGETTPEIEMVNEKIRSVASKWKNRLKVFGGIAGLATLLYSAANHQEGPPTGEDWKTKHDRATREMQENGITSEQKMAYELWLNDIIYRGFSPMIDVGEYYALGGKVSFKLVKHMIGSFIKNEIVGREDLGPVYEDTWRVYLGLPQEHNTLGISDYRPSKSKDNVYYYKLNDVEQVLLTGAGYELKNIIKSLAENDPKGKYLALSRPLGRYTWQLGEDEKGKYVSYYDRWDLDLPGEKGRGLIGIPYEVYDRFYYDPATFEVIK